MSSESAPLDNPASKRKWYQAIGPGLITACVVIGPGSIMTSSNVGATKGYSMGWIVVVSVIFMLTFMTMGAKLGVSAADSAATVITRKAGRWLAVLIGLSVFFISAAFQFGNNLGVHYALIEFINFDYLIVIFNGLAIAFLLIFKDMYKALEKLMMAFVGLMLASFALNLLLAFLSDPRPAEIAAGFVPQMGDIDLNILGLIGTTFVTSAAFYQSYLVRQKGWTADDLKTGLIDVRVGAIIMALITMMLMFTPATQFHPTFKTQSVVTTTGDSDYAEDTTWIIDNNEESLKALKADLDAKWEKEHAGEDDAKKPTWAFVSKKEFDETNKLLTEAKKQPAQVAPREFDGLVEVGKALEPLFKGFGPTLFFLGVFAAAYSSFLVNSMIGGFILADGLGIGNKPEDKWPKIFTIAVLVVGMLVGLYTIIILGGTKPVPVLVAAQAVTVVASPLVAGALLWLTSSRSVMGEHVNGPLLKTLGSIGLGILILMSYRTLTVSVIPGIEKFLSAAGGT